MHTDMFENWSNDYDTYSLLRPTISPYFINEYYACSYRLFIAQYLNYITPVMINRKFTYFTIRFRSPSFMDKIELIIKTHAKTTLVSTMIVEIFINKIILFIIFI